MSSRFSGAVLLELIVASGVFLIVSTSVVTLVMGARSLVVDTGQAITATDYAQEGLEAMRLIRDDDWNNLADGTYGLIESGGNWQLNGSSDTKNGFTRTATITTNSANSKTIVSRVTWQALPNRAPVVSLVTILTNWQNTQQDNFLDGDWKNPITAGEADVDSGAQGTDVQVDNGIVYLSSSASLQVKPDLSIFNVADAYNPIKLSSVDLGVSNVSKIAKSTNHVFGSIAGSLDEYLTVDVTNPASPVKINSKDISNGKSLSLAVAGTKLFVGMEKVSGEPEFFAVDISDPNNPIVLGNLEINASINAIAIFYNRAYIATTADDGELMILDVTNPASMNILGQFNAQSTEDGYSVFVKDEFNVYLGRDISNSAEEFYVLDAGNPASIVQKGSFNLAARVNDMVAVNRLVFMVTEQPNAEFRILDIADPLNIYSYAYLNFPQNATGIAYENNTIYSSVRSNSALRILVSG